MNNNGKPAQPAMQIVVSQPTPDEVAVCKRCGAAYWLETKIIAIKPSMLVGAGQTRMEKPGIIICGACLAPAVLPWLTHGEAVEIAKKNIAEAPSGEIIQQDQEKRG